jgi:hypothetical protein
VPRAPHLGTGRREGAQPPRRALAGRREHERGLGLVELLGDRAHQCVVEVTGVGDDGQRVAGQRRVGEDVNEEEWQRVRHAIGRGLSHGVGATVLALCRARIVTRPAAG